MTLTTDDPQCRVFMKKLSPQSVSGRIRRSILALLLCIYMYIKDEHPAVSRLGPPSVLARGHWWRWRPMIHSVAFSWKSFHHNRSVGAWGVQYLHFCYMYHWLDIGRLVASYTCPFWNIFCFVSDYPAEPPSVLACSHWWRWRPMIHNVGFSWKSFHHNWSLGAWGVQYLPFCDMYHWSQMSFPY